MSNFDTYSTTLATAVAASGTITFTYAAYRDAGTYAGTYGHVLITSTGVKITHPTFTITFGTSTTFTVTWPAGYGTLPVGTVVRLQAEIAGSPSADGSDFNTNRAGAAATRLHPVLLNFGAVDAAAANSISASQSVGAAANFLLNGATAGTLDVPRNVVAAWTTTSILTITGLDEYGATVVEVSASGTSHTGKKAFKSITSISSSASITSATVGTGKVLGLPYRLSRAGNVITSLEDGVAATAGTVVAGLTTVSTSTSNDVRGTWAPNGTPDGTIQFQCVALFPDINDRGVAQYAG